MKALTGSDPSWPYRLDVPVRPMSREDRAAVAAFVHGTHCLPSDYRPACWEWREYAYRCAEQDIEPVFDRGWPRDLATLRAWHRGQCADCGRRPRRLVCDHDHWSGFVRGYLCDACNHKPSGWYEDRHPARMFQLRIPYSAAAARRAAS
jgi:hypothetical protein